MPEAAEEHNDFIATRTRKGRLLVRAIVILNGALTLLGFAASLIAGAASPSACLMTPFWLFVYLMLYMGRPWAKWLFVGAGVLTGITLITTLTQMPAGVFQGAVPGPLLFAAGVSALGVVVMVVSAVLLLCSASVSEFLYGQETSY